MISFDLNAIYSRLTWLSKPFREGNCRAGLSFNRKDRKIWLPAVRDGLHDYFFEGASFDLSYAGAGTTNAQLIDF
jgi:hypothetical protein